MAVITKFYTDFIFNPLTKSFSVNFRDEKLMKILMDKYPNVHFFKAVEPFDNAYYANKQLADAVKEILAKGSKEDIDLVKEYLHLTEEQLKSIEHEFIVYGDKFADVITLGHEIGHHYHTTKGNAFTRTAHKYTWADKLRGHMTYLNIGLLVIFKKKVIPLNFLGQLSLSLPQLTAEAAASNYSLKLLKELITKDKDDLKYAKKDLKNAFKTYFKYHAKRCIFPIKLEMSILGNDNKPDTENLTIRRTDSEVTKLAKKIALQRKLDDTIKYRYV